VRSPAGIGDSAGSGYAAASPLPLPRLPRDVLLPAPIYGHSILFFPLNLFLRANNQKKSKKTCTLFP